MITFKQYLQEATAPISMEKMAEMIQRDCKRWFAGLLFRRGALSTEALVALS